MQKKPNIIFLFSDQQRWDTLGCYGQHLDVTPNLDKMAAQGVKFEHAFTCQPVCGPARACLQTGKYATELGCFRNGIALPLDEKTIAQSLAAAGYETGYIGKWHLASHKQHLDHLGTGDPEQGDIDYQTTAIPPERRGGYTDCWIASDVLEFTSHGYDGYLFNQDMEKVEFKGYRVDALTNFALDFLRNRNGEKPFFLFVSYIEPHHQNDHNHYEGPDGSKERFKDFEAPGDLAELEGDWREEYPDYLGCCASIDENIGRIRMELETLGLDENTLIVYTSDHGSHFRTRNREMEEGNYDDYKRSCHDAAIHIPLILYGPGFRGGKILDEMVSLIDFPPTILAAAGLEPNGWMRGRPLQELVAGSAQNWPQEVFLQISESQVGRALRTKKWKYSVRAPGKNGSYESASDLYVEDYLYDLENDPHELHNLVRDPVLIEVRKELADLLTQKMSEIGENVPEIKPAL